MKKTLISMMLVLCCLLSFVGCGGDTSHRSQKKNYNEAVSLFNSGEYVSAEVIFKSLGDYSDSQDFIEKCHEKIYEKAKQCLSDGAFEDAKALFESLGEYEDSDTWELQCDWLCTMEESILDRMKSSSEETKDYRALVNTEITFLSKFVNNYLGSMNNLFKRYMEGLEVQKAALDESWYGDYQIKWLDGKVMRMEVLRALYSEYNFLSDNRDFVSRYISGYEHDKMVRDGYFAVMDDIWNQRGDAFELLYFDDTFGWKIKNNTEFTFSIVWEVNFREGDTIRDSDICTVENVEPGQSYIVEFWWPDYDFYYDWRFYFIDMSR